MADFVDCAGFLKEARNQTGIGAEIGAQHLDRHPLADHGVFGQVYGTHAAFADNADDFVVADAATDQVFLVGDYIRT